MVADTTRPIAIACALETSTRAGSVALRTGDRTRTIRLADARAHASDLLPALATLARELDVARDDGKLRLDAVFVGLGPGSYTGLRVGIATALGLARASGAVLRGVPSFEALALAELRPEEDGTIALDARAARFYHARYRRTENDVIAVEEPRAITASELRRSLEQPGPILGDERVADAAELDAALRARLRSDARPDANAVLELGLRRLAEHGPHAEDALEPLYLREFGER